MPTHISFTTCNLLNLNRPGRKMYGDADGWTEDQYEAKLDFLSHILPVMQADVFGFQELWSGDALQDVLDRAGLAETHQALVPPDHDGKSIICGGAVRRDILVGEPTWIEDFPESFRLQSSGDDAQTPDIGVNISGFSRPVLHFMVQPEAEQEPINVYVVHFKSKRPTDIWREDWYVKETYSRYNEALGAALSTIRRTAEAAAFRMMLIDQTRDNDHPVVVLGDINDSTLSNTVNILTGQPRYLFGSSAGGSDFDFYTLQTLQQYRSTRDVYYTHIFNNERESLDHILVSQEFYDNSRKRIWALHSMEIANDHLNRDDHKTSGTTDHGIVRAEFVLNPARK